MSSKALEPLLKRNNFTSDFVVADFENGKYHQLSVLVATANMPLDREGLNHEVIILETSNPSHTSQALATRLALELGNSSVKARRLRWDKNSSKLRGKICISLLELETPFLQDLGERDFTAIKESIVRSSSLLWITALDNPAKALASGMARSIRNEVPGIQFRTLSVPAKSLDSPDQLAPLIGKLTTTSTPDDEFLEKDGVLEICRVVEDRHMNEKLSSWLAEGKGKIEFVPLEQVDGPQKLAIKAQGMLDTLYLEADEEVISDIDSDEVEIEVKATGLK